MALGAQLGSFQEEFGGHQTRIIFERKWRVSCNLTPALRIPRNRYPKTKIIEIHVYGKISPVFGYLLRGMGACLD